MTTIKAKRIQEALAKAKTVGRVEQEVTIDGCSLVLQSLTPSDYEAILAECEDRSDLEYLHAYQAGHVSRSIVEIDGQDLHEVQFVEDEVPAGVWGITAFVSSEPVAKSIAEGIQKAGGKVTLLPPDGTETRVINVEVHDWLRDNVISEWGREALTVAWRKFTEVVVEADKKAKEGIQFLIPDESSEEKYRRLIGEMKETEDDLPVEIVKRVLSEAGYVLSSPLSEIETATEKLDVLAAEQETAMEDVQKPAETAPAPAAPAAAPPQQAPPAPVQAPPAPVSAEPSPEDLMRRRKPLNQQAINTPAPQPTQQPRVVSAGHRPEISPELRARASSNTESLSRAQRIANLEGAVDPSLAEELPTAPHRPEEVPLLEKARTGIDSKALAASVDQPPGAGINPRYKPPPR